VSSTTAGSPTIRARVRWSSRMKFSCVRYSTAGLMAVEVEGWRPIPPGSAAASHRAPSAAPPAGSAARPRVVRRGERPDVLPPGVRPGRRSRPSSGRGKRERAGLATNSDWPVRRVPGHCAPAVSSPAVELKTVKPGSVVAVVVAATRFAFVRQRGACSQSVSARQSTPLWLPAVDVRGWVLRRPAALIQRQRRRPGSITPRARTS